MQLSEILKNVELVDAISANVEIKNIQFDSRKVEAGSLFVATRGTAVDGHDYIAKAVEAGAVAIVCEDMPSEQQANVAYIKVKDSAEALGRMASNFYGRPSEQLTLVGVTGTNGKTTVGKELSRLTGLPVLDMDSVIEEQIGKSIPDIFKEYGADSRLGFTASIMMSCTESVFYTMSVYFMSVKIKKTRYTLAGCLIATLSGIVASVILAKYF